MQVHSKVVLVTGAARRIGSAIAKHFHDQGFRVALHYNTSKNEALQLCQSFESIRPDSAFCVQADLSKVLDTKAMVQYIKKQWGRLDVLVNNASTYYPIPFLETTESQFDELMNSNLKGTYFLCQSAFPLLIESEGSVVNILDTELDFSYAGFSAYFVTKSGLHALTRSLAAEFAATLRINAVSPGMVLLPEKAPLSEDQKAARIKKIPMGRLGTPEEIAEAVYFMATGPKYITGQILSVDGGRSIA